MRQNEGAAFVIIYFFYSALRWQRLFCRRGFWFASTRHSAFFQLGLRKLFARNFAYDMFSPRYRGQVSFDTWHQLFITHWRMFHADVLRSETPAQSGKGVTLEIYLHGGDDRDYRARFTLIRTDGRWWIDDVHWEQEPDERAISRT
jgi:hypothetical protein